MTLPTVPLGTTGMDITRVGLGAWAVGDLTNEPDLSLLTGADTVVHTVARTHVMADSAADPLAAYRRVNVDASRWRVCWP